MAVIVDPVKLSLGMKASLGKNLGIKCLPETISHTPQAIEQNRHIVSRASTIYNTIDWN